MNELVKLVFKVLILLIITAGITYYLFGREESNECPQHTTPHRESGECIEYWVTSIG